MILPAYDVQRHRQIIQRNISSFNMRAMVAQMDIGPVKPGHADWRIRQQFRAGIGLGSRLPFLWCRIGALARPGVPPINPFKSTRSIWFDRRSMVTTGFVFAFCVRSALRSHLDRSRRCPSCPGDPGSPQTELVEALQIELSRNLIRRRLRDREANQRFQQPHVRSAEAQPHISPLKASGSSIVPSSATRVGPFATSGRPAMDVRRHATRAARPRPAGR